MSVKEAYTCQYCGYSSSNRYEFMRSLAQRDLKCPKCADKRIKAKKTTTGDVFGYNEDGHYEGDF